MSTFSIVTCRLTLAVAISVGLAFHGLKRRSLSKSGAFAAVFVGFISFAVSYRFGIILILFYYTGSKLTKYKEEEKMKLEDSELHIAGGQRTSVQVFACSIFATFVAIIYYIYVGEDKNVDFKNENALIGSYLWVAYVAHYACCAGDTWASEIGILSKSNPRLITTLLIKEVPPGTNGGMSLIGTVASASGGVFIGIVYYLISLLMPNNGYPQHPMIVIGFIGGFVGSLLDSLMGATLQASYYSNDRNCIMKTMNKNDKSIIKICGYDILTNEQVNLFSTLLCMFVTASIGPFVFAMYV